KVRSPTRAARPPVAGYAMRRIGSWRLAAVLVTAAGWASAGPVTDWAQQAGNSQHTNYTSASIDPTTLTFAWHAPAGYSQPIVVNGSVYALSTANGNGSPFSVASFDLVTGHTNWSISETAGEPTAVAYADGLLVYCGEPGTKGQLYVRDAQTSALKYTVSLG